MTITPEFDVDGNMTAYGEWSFTWDGENQLIEVASAGLTVVQNQYDYMSRRVMKTTSTETIEYVYDGWNLLAESRAEGPTNHYVWGLDLSGTL